MEPRGPVSLLVMSAALAAAPPTFALVLPGGRAPGEARRIDKTRDCWVGLEVCDLDVSGTNKRNKVVQRSCVGSCTFHTSVCVDEPTKKCAVPALTGITVDNTALVPPSALSGAHVCGAEAALAVSEGHKLTIDVTASAGSGGFGQGQVHVGLQEQQEEQGLRLDHDHVSDPAGRLWLSAGRL